MRNKCINCRRELPQNAIYCCWCGKKQIKEKLDITIPKPRHNKDGTYSGQIMVDGNRCTVKEQSEKEYYAKATVIKTGKALPEEVPTLKEAIQKYIKANTDVLSPSTIRGYDNIKRNRFKAYMPMRIDTIPYQEMLNEEAKKQAPKTVCNGWGLVYPAIEFSGMQPPKVNLPTVPESDLEYLTPDEIKTFLALIKGDSCELTALLALHSLRVSEMLHLDAKDIRNNIIHVKGASVQNIDGQWVEKETNKTKQSRRDIPVMIPRLLELIPKSGKVITTSQTCVWKHLHDICEINGLTVCSQHDLRRTFASLAAYLGFSEDVICKMGGWSPGSQVVHKVYIKVSNKEIKESAKAMQDFLIAK